MVITVLAITYIVVQFHVKRTKNKQAIEYIRNGIKPVLAEAGLEMVGVGKYRVSIGAAH